MSTSVFQQAIDEVYNSDNDIVDRNRMYKWLCIYGSLKLHIDSALDEKTRSNYYDIRNLFLDFYNSSLINNYILESNNELELLKFDKDNLIDFLIKNESFYNDVVKTIHHSTIHESKVNGDYINHTLGTLKLKLPLAEHINTIDFYNKFEKVYEPFFSLMCNLTADEFYSDYGEEEEITLERTVRLARKYNIQIPELDIDS